METVWKTVLDLVASLRSQRGWFTARLLQQPTKRPNGRSRVCASGRECVSVCLHMGSFLTPVPAVNTKECDGGGGAVSKQLAGSVFSRRFRQSVSNEVRWPPHGPTTQSTTPPVIHEAGANASSPGIQPTAFHSTQAENYTFSFVSPLQDVLCMHHVLQIPLVAGKTEFRFPQQHGRVLGATIDTPEMDGRAQLDDLQTCTA